MNLPSILVWGFAATIVLTAMTIAAQSLGLTRVRYTVAKSDCEPLKAPVTTSSLAPVSMPRDAPVYQAKRERIQPDKLHVRKDGDKVLYSQVMVVEVGGTRQIFVAGQTPRDRDGKCVGKGDMRAQIEQVGENIKAALEAAGATLADIVKTTTYVTDMRYRLDLAPLREEFLGKKGPASTLVEISALAHPDWMIEIEAIAVI